MPAEKSKAQNIPFGESYKIRDKRSGKVYTWWDKTPPTPEQARQYIHDQEHMNPWDIANEPLSRGPSRDARRFAAGGEQPASMFGIRQKLSDAIQPHDEDSPWMASLRGFGRGAAIGTGDLASSLSNPINLGTTILSAGSSLAAGEGLTGVAKALQWGQKGISAAQAAHGTYRAGEGAYEKDPAKFGSGMVEAAMGGLGLYSPKAKVSEPILGEIVDAPINTRSAPRQLYESPVEGERVSPGARTLPTSRQKALPPIGGTYEPPSPTELPPSPYGGRERLPSSGSTYYGGRYGTGTDLNTVAETYSPPAIPDIEAPTAPPPVRGRPALRNPATGMERFSDTDLQFAARTGDKAAALELRNRAKAAAKIRQVAGEREASGLSPLEDLTEPSAPQPAKIGEQGLAQEKPQAKLSDIGAPPELVDKLKESLRIHDQSNDSVLFMAEQGEPSFIKEATRRGLAGFKRVVKRTFESSDTGAVGPGADKLIKQQRQFRSRLRDLDLREKTTRRTGESPEAIQAEREALLQSYEKKGPEAAALANQERFSSKMIELRNKTWQSTDKATTTALRAQRRALIQAAKAGGENPIAGLFNKLKDAKDFNDTRFILPDGTRKTHSSYIHNEAAKELGTNLAEALDNGVVRFAANSNGAEVGSPITSAQAEQLADGAYYAGHGSMDIDLRLPDKMNYKSFPRGTDPEAIRQWVKTQFANVQAENPREMLMNRGLPEHVVKDLTDEQATAAIDALRESDDVPGEQPHWIKRLFGDESGSVSTNMMTGGVFSKQGVINPAKGTPYEATFAKWVNKKAAAKVEAVLKAGEFKELEPLGKAGVTSFVNGSRTGKLREVQNFISDKVQALDDANVSGKGTRHLTEIFDNTPAEIQDAYKKMDRETSYSMDTMFRELKKGTDAGLTPKFNSIPHLVEWYGEKIDRMIANKQYRDIFKKNEWVKLKGEGDVDWQDLPNTLFPPANIEGRSRSWVASPEFATLIKNHLGEESKVIKYAGDLASLGKNLSLSAGPIPGSGINAHGANIMARSVMANISSNPGRIVTHGKYILKPSTALKDLNTMKGRMVEAVNDGLTMSSEGYSFGQEGGSAHLLHNITGLDPKSLAGKAVTLTGKWFEDPLFQKVIPAIKLKHHLDLKDDFMRQGMSRENAGKQAAEFTNELYGGINWQAMGRSKDLQNMSRAVVLAPDWLETNLRLGKHITQSLGELAPSKIANLKSPLTPEGNRYHKLIMGIGATYIAGNAINMATAGHPMWSNDPGHTLDVYLGTASNGKKRWLRSFGTSADFIRLPVDAATAAIGTSGQGHDLGQTSEIAGNRMSIPTSFLTHFITKRDRFGRPILGQDDYGRPLSLTDQGLSLGLEAASTVMPPYVKSGVDYMRGKAGAEEALVGGFELGPLRYSSPPKKTYSTTRQRSSRSSRSSR